MRPVYLRAVETAVPEHAYPQDALRDVMKSQPSRERRTPLLIRRVFDQSGIRTRHSVIADLQPGHPGGPFYNPASGEFLNPGTGTRNDVYTSAAKTLFECAARRALDRHPSLRAEDVTHVITVSCTGFFSPGPDYHLVRSLSLAPSVQRYHLGFMGCYAAFPALRAAQAFCHADPDAVVLVVCLELCTVHYRHAEDPDTLIANSVFADGAAAALVSARAPGEGERALQLDHFETTLIPSSEGDMAWTVGDHGFEMVLSTYVPGIIEENIHAAFAPLLERTNVALPDLRHWAVHPGGRSILDKVQHSLQLSDEQMQPSRAVLAEYGNMSSPTVLFVLERLLKREPAQHAERVAAVAFGPGLTVETALLTKPGRAAP